MQLMISLLTTSLVFLSGCNSSQTVNTPIINKISWVSSPDPVKYVSYAIASLYGPFPDSKMIEVNQTWTEDHKKIYQITLYGIFHKSGIQEVADELSFSVFADGTKIWGLIAKDKSEKTLWQEDDFHITQEHLDFRGKSVHWKGDFQLNDAKVWTTNFQNYGIWASEKYYLTYIGTNDHVNHSINFTLDKGVGKLSGKQIDVTPGKPTLVSKGGGGNVAVPDINTPLESSVTIDGQTETFQLKVK